MFLHNKRIQIAAIFISNVGHCSNVRHDSLFSRSKGMTMEALLQKQTNRQTDKSQTVAGLLYSHCCEPQARTRMTCSKCGMILKTILQIPDFELLGIFVGIVSFMHWRARAGVDACTANQDIYLRA
jgi:hypothetical protein